MNYFCYIIRCVDGTLYTGITTNVQRRMDEHNGIKKGGAKYTKGRRPIVLEYYEGHNSRSEAQVREYQLKQLTHAQKKLLCRSSNKLNHASNAAILKK